MTNYAHHSAKMGDANLFNALVKRAAEKGMLVQFVPTIYKGAWPSASSKPYHLFVGDKRTTFASLERLQNKLNSL